MDEARWSRLGEEVEPGGRPGAPEPLRIVQQFVNTSNHEVGPELDKLRTPARARTWLTRHGLLGPTDPLSKDDHEALLGFRDALREWLLVPAGRPTSPDASRMLRQASGNAPVVVMLGKGADLVRLLPAGEGVHRAIGSVLAAVHTAASIGQLARLKGCGECGWAFFDRSKNRSGTWCAMAVCGNRLKNRSLRARKRAHAR